MQAVVDDAAGPDVNQTGVVGCNGAADDDRRDMDDIMDLDIDVAPLD